MLSQGIYVLLGSNPFAFYSLSNVWCSFFSYFGGNYLFYLSERRGTSSRDRYYADNESDLGGQN